MKEARGQIVLKCESNGPYRHYRIIGTKLDLAGLSEWLAASLRQVSEPVDKPKAIELDGFDISDEVRRYPEIGLCFLVEPDMNRYLVSKPPPSEFKEKLILAATVVGIVFAFLSLIAGAGTVLKGTWDILVFWTKWLLQAS